MTVSHDPHSSCNSLPASIWDSTASDHTTHELADLARLVISEVTVVFCRYECAYGLFFFDVLLITCLPEQGLSVTSIALLMLKYLVPGYLDFLPALGSEEMASTQNILLMKDNPPNVKVALNSLTKVVDSLTMLKLIDSWSVGIIIFSMLTNTGPFIEDENKPDMRRRIAERYIDWGMLLYKHVSTPEQLPIIGLFLILVLLLVVHCSLSLFYFLVGSTLATLFLVILGLAVAIKHDLSDHPDDAKINAAVDEIQCDISVLSAVPSVNMPGMQTRHISGLHALLNSVGDSEVE
ncbi:hypothetical protein EI94DRAFT_1801592 [Lactarius quietus]|nr:hypothetical protein EI94DRAFT_1801592 [Lactarius quietus]